MSNDFSNIDISLSKISISETENILININGINGIDSIDNKDLQNNITDDAIRKENDIKMMTFFGRRLASQLFRSV